MDKIVAGRDDSHVVVSDVVRNESREFDLEGDLTPRVGHWSNYPMTVARRVARNSPGANRGADVAFASDLKNRTDLAGYLAVVENGQTFGALQGDRGVGTFGDAKPATMICIWPPC